ncbi:MAG: RdgB/HAM1 family non-canonical purine NTP pyrophosphatase [Pseudomonadota bacterium]|nr:RdgB/HAM1 family non-canonical purine NTP pyrophosphatase [Pseudomonadota bacterium]
MERIVFASSNRGKAKEIQSNLGNSTKLIMQADFGVESIEETGKSFLDNALLKAKNAARQTGFPSLADDSGLMVKALEGAPGVYSARYAGPNASDKDNVDKLLQELEDVPIEKRDAKFICVLVFVRDENDSDPIIARGDWNGRIAFEPFGEGGFGYDPVFIDDQLNLASAQLSAEEKNLYSHRGKALLDLKKSLAKLI